MRNQLTAERLKDELHKNAGDLFAAVKLVGVSLGFIKQWMKDDDEFKSFIEEARSVGAEVLYSEAIRRAVTGIDKGIYYKGLKVDTETIYSDALLTQLMKAKLPDFKTTDSNSTNVAVSVDVNLMPRADSYDEWLAMKKATIPEHHKLTIL